MIPNIFKVGFTTRTLNERIRELSSTGLPEPFKLEIYFLLDLPEEGEKVLHKALNKYKYKKEFFRIPLKDIVRISKETFYASNLLIHKIDGPACNLYFTDDEKNKILEHNHKIKTEEEERSRKEAAKKIKIIKAETLFEEIAPKVNNILKRSDISLSDEIISYALVLSVVGWPWADKFNPPAFDSGVKLASELTKHEKSLFLQFKDVVEDLESLDAYPIAAERFRLDCQKKGINDWISIRKSFMRNPATGFYDNPLTPSDTLRGVLNSIYYEKIKK